MNVKNLQKSILDLRKMFHSTLCPLFGTFYI